MSREQIARAAVEGVVCGLLDTLDALGAQAPGGSRPAGGRRGSRSAAYRQVVADLCELPVSLADADEAVATGACVQAAAVARGDCAPRRRRAMGPWRRYALEPSTGDTAGVRARYAELRSTTYPSTA